MEANQFQLANLMRSKEPDFSKCTIDETIYDFTYAGFPVMLGLVTILHFLFQFLNQSSFADTITPVFNNTNGLMREVFWAVALFSVFDFTYLKDKVNNYFTAKLIGIATFGITVMLLDSLLGTFLGTNNIMYDAMPFIAGAAVCQYVSFLIYHQPVYQIGLNHVSKLAIVSIAIMLSFSTNHTSANNFHSTEQMKQLHATK